MSNTVEGMPTKETWDNVSLDYTIEINDDERLYAEEIYKLLQKEKIYPPARLLELGSGSGHLSACLAQKGYNVALLDFSTGALEKSRQTFEKYNLNGEFIEADLFDLSSVTSKYDFVWNSGVMEHFNDENLQKIFEQICNVMKNKFIFLVPNPDSISYLLMRYNLEGEGRWEYGQEYMRRNYLDIAQKAGLSGRVLGYAASSISIWHFESTFLKDPNRKIYKSIVDDGIMPPNESYLIAYIVGKAEETEEKVQSVRSEETSSPAIELEQFFAKSAENFSLRKRIKENQELKEEEQKQFVAEIERYKSEKNLSDSKIQNLTAEIEKYQERIQDFEKEKKKLEALIEEKEVAIKEKEITIEDKENTIREKEECISDISNKNKELNVTLSKKNEENEMYRSKIDKTCGEILPQITGATAGICNIFTAKWFSKVVAVHAVVGALVQEPFINKIKILVKMALRLVGKKYDLLIDNYRMNFKVAQYARTIDNLVQIARVGVSTTASSERCVIDTQDVLEAPVNLPVYADEPLISVLLPVYNHAAFIKDAIKGVQNQTYSNWELIILNDGSTDGLLDILKDYNNDPRIKIYTQDNQRLPNGLTNLHNLATGEFITWTSADNVMEKEMLSTLVHKLLEEPDAVMVYADVAIIDENGKYKTTGYREMNRDPQLPYIMRLPHCTDALDAEADNFINACFMYKAAPVKALKGQYSADLEGLEDYDFWIRLRTFGEIVHLNNKTPLYCYRVHENTMSEDLLKNKLEEHSKRTKKMIEYSQLKDEFAKKSWNVVIEPKAEGCELLEKNLNDLNYSYKEKSSKTVRFVDKAQIKALKDKEFAVDLENGYYRVWVNNNGQIENRANIYQGFNVNTLAKKVRQTYIEGLFWEYPAKFVNMSVLGTHIDLNDIDVEKTIEFISANPNILFSFCLLNEGETEAQEKISKACENVIFMGKREFGNQMFVYASWNAMFIPPLKNDIDIMPYILLGWNIGRWIMVADQDMRNALPFVSSYYYGEKLLGIKTIENIGNVENILNAYIEYYSTTGAVKNIIAFLNGIAQDILVDRPDFKLQHKERKFPPTLVKREIETPAVLKKGYVGVMVDSLDKGGLEQVVAHLVREFSMRGIEVRVLCTTTGGEVARKLSAEGYTVVDFAGDSKKFEQYIKEEKPILINTHYTKKMLDIVVANNIPIVEVIHNMYVFQNEAFLKAEKKLSKNFEKMIAVSSIVKEIYEKRVLGTSSDKIVVVGNAADPHKVKGYDRNYTRSLLGIPEKSTVFINVSSIDSRKNQMGLVKAFERFNMTVDPDSYLILVGNVLSEFYDGVVSDFIEATACKSHIIKLNYHREIGDLYKAADIFVMPSFFEGWSIAATEALYTGLPIIHSLCGSGKELVKNGENGILIPNPEEDIASVPAEKLLADMNAVNPKAVDDMVDAMTEMVNNIAVWKEKRGAISLTSIMNYNQDKMVDSYIDVFAEVLNK